MKVQRSNRSFLLLPSARGFLHLLFLLFIGRYNGNIMHQQSTIVSSFFVAANDTTLNPNVCTNKESGVVTKAKILCRISGRDTDADCFDPNITKAMGRMFPTCQELDVEIKYKLVNPNNFDMWVVIIGGGQQEGDDSNETNLKTKLLFNGNDVTFSTTPDTALSHKMIIKGHQSHIAKVETKINTCQQFYKTEMKMKLRPVESRNGFGNTCSSVDYISFDAPPSFQQDSIPGSNAVLQKNSPGEGKGVLKSSSTTSIKGTKSPSKSDSIGKGSQSSLSGKGKSSSGKGKTLAPSGTPTLSPSVSPSLTPSDSPSSTPSLLPTDLPSETPCPEGYVTYENGSPIPNQSLSCARDACCIGPNSCTAFSGKVCRDGSCDGPNSCRFAKIAEISGPSCVGEASCRASIIGQVHGGSCMEQNACRSATVDVAVLRESCVGEASCRASTIGRVSGKSCQGQNACRFATVEGEIFGQSCIGEASCRASTIGQVSGKSCTGEDACRFSTILEGVLQSSCVGEASCRESNIVQVAGSSCIGEDACRLATVVGPVLEEDCVGDGICRGDPTS